MSLYDDFAQLRDQLVDGFEVPTATVSSTARSQSPADRAAGIVNTTGATRTVRALLGKRTIAILDGTLVTQSTAKCFSEVKQGETITLGSHSYLIASVEIIDTTGTQPYFWLAILK